MWEASKFLLGSVISVFTWISKYITWISKQYPRFYSKHYNSEKRILFTCKDGGSEHQNSTYIGQTTTTLSRRLTMHLASGLPKQHTTNAHKTILNRENIVNNTNILPIENDPYRLSILEALLIHKTQPSINKQLASTHRTLKLFTS